MSHSDFNIWRRNPNPTPEEKERFEIELFGYSAHMFDWNRHNRQVGRSLVCKGKRLRDRPRRSPLPSPSPDNQDLTCKPSQADRVPSDAGLLLIDQAAAYLGTTSDQVAAFVADGELSYINLGRGKKRARYRFTVPDLQEFIERRRRREVLCQSTSPKSRRTTSSTSRSEVIGFMAARAAQLAGKPKPSKP
jgi:hypothetical protein